jgi:hypothetical protein
MDITTPIATLLLLVPCPHVVLACCRLACSWRSSSTSILVAALVYIAKGNRVCLAGSQVCGVVYLLLLAKTLNDLCPFVNMTDVPRQRTVKIYCPKCDDIYFPKQSRHMSELVVPPADPRDRWRCWRTAGGYLCVHLID